MILYKLLVLLIYFSTRLARKVATSWRGEGEEGGISSIKSLVLTQQLNYL